MSTLSEQELRYLAMEVVGKDLEQQDYEFLAVNSELRKDPQFVALKEGKLHFVVVRATEYPANPKDYDEDFMLKMRDHAIKFKARTFYAGVGFGHSNGYNVPIKKGEAYSIAYSGLIEIK